MGDTCFVQTKHNIAHNTNVGILPALISSQYTITSSSIKNHFGVDWVMITLTGTGVTRIMVTWASTYMITSILHPLCISDRTNRTDSVRPDHPEIKSAKLSPEKTGKQVFGFRFFFAMTSHQWPFTGCNHEDPRWIPLIELESSCLLSFFTPQNLSCKMSSLF